MGSNSGQYASGEIGFVIKNPDQPSPVAMFPIKVSIPPPALFSVSLKLICVDFFNVYLYYLQNVFNTYTLLYSKKGNQRCRVK